MSMSHHYRHYINQDRSNPPAVIRWPSQSSRNGAESLHRNVLYGKLQKIKYYVASGISVDAVNKEGQSPLFCAAFTGKTESLELLLSLGADPNFRCLNGNHTPVHAASYSGCVVNLRLLIQAGGDLRLTDDQNNRPIDWANMQKDEEKVRGIRELIEMARLAATQKNGSLLLKELNAVYPISCEPFREKVKDLIRRSSRGREVYETRDNLTNRIFNTGFGKVYFGSGFKSAGVVGVPFINELKDLELEKDQEAASWMCGKFTTFIPFIWRSRKTLVSARQLRKRQHDNGAVVDILISEFEILTKLNHPRILNILGVCQSESGYSITLVFERVMCGSLYFLLYQERKRLSPRLVTDAIIQVSEALEYIHSQGILHCGITSHSIMIMEFGGAKLSCFEYALPFGGGPEFANIDSISHPLLSSDAHISFLRHWMAPEVLLDYNFSKRADVYSLCSVMWELCYGEVPWAEHSLDALKYLFKETGDSLTVDQEIAPELWFHVLSLGLSPRWEERDMDIGEIRDMMILSKRKSGFHSGSSSASLSKRMSTASMQKQQEKYERERPSNDHTGIDMVDEAIECPQLLPTNEKMKEHYSTSSLPPGNKFLPFDVQLSPNPVLKARKAFGVKELPKNSVQLLPSEVNMELMEQQGRGVLRKTRSILKKVTDLIDKTNGETIYETPENAIAPIPPPRERKTPSKTYQSTFGTQTEPQVMNVQGYFHKVPNMPEKTQTGAILSLGAKNPTTERSFNSQKLTKNSSKEKARIKPASHNLERQTSSSNFSNFFSNFGGNISKAILRSLPTLNAENARIKPAGHSLEIQTLEPQAKKDAFCHTADFIPVREEPNIKNAHHSLDRTFPPMGHVYSVSEKFKTHPLRSLHGIRRGVCYSRLPREIRRAIFLRQRYFLQPSEFPRPQWLPANKDLVVIKKPMEGFNFQEQVKVDASTQWIDFDSMKSQGNEQKGVQKIPTPTTELFSPRKALIQERENLAKRGIFTDWIEIGQMDPNEGCATKKNKSMYQLFHKETSPERIVSPERSKSPQRSEWLVTQSGGVKNIVESLQKQGLALSILNQSNRLETPKHSSTPNRSNNDHPTFTVPFSGFSGEKNDFSLRSDGKFVTAFDFSLSNVMYDSSLNSEQKLMIDRGTNPINDCDVEKMNEKIGEDDRCASGDSNVFENNVESAQGVGPDFPDDFINNVLKMAEDQQQTSRGRLPSSTPEKEAGEIVDQGTSEALGDGAGEDSDCIFLCEIPASNAGLETKIEAFTGENEVLANPKGDTADVGGNKQEGEKGVEVDGKLQGVVDIDAGKIQGEGDELEEGEIKESFNQEPQLPQFTHNKTI